MTEREARYGTLSEQALLSRSSHLLAESLKRFVFPITSCERQEILLHNESVVRLHFRSPSEAHSYLASIQTRIEKKNQQCRQLWRAMLSDLDLELEQDEHTDISNGIRCRRLGSDAEVVEQTKRESKSILSSMNQDVRLAAKQCLIWSPGFEIRQRWVVNEVAIGLWKLGISECIDWILKMGSNNSSIVSRTSMLLLLLDLKRLKTQNDGSSIIRFYKYLAQAGSIWESVATVRILEGSDNWPPELSRFVIPSILGERGAPGGKVGSWYYELIQVLASNSSADRGGSS